MSNDARIPPDLLLVQEFVNTREIDEGTDEIATPETLTRWLTAHELGRASDRFTAEDVLQAQALREALRALLFHNNGEPLDRDALVTLDALGAEAPLQVTFDKHARASLAPARTGFAGVIARLLASVARAEAEGTFERLKACGATDCKWAYYDHSRNRSRHWCSMRVCGNRAKARSYRSRQHEHPPRG